MLKIIEKISTAYRIRKINKQLKEISELCNECIAFCQKPKPDLRAKVELVRRNAQ